MLPTSCAFAGRRSGVHGGRRLGLDIHRHRAIGTPSASAGMCASEAKASPPFSRSPWGLLGCMPRPPPVRRGGWPCGWITAQYLSDHFTNQIKFWGIQPSYHSSNSPRPTSRREVQSHAQGTDHPWPHLPQHRGAAERRPRVRRTVQCPVDRGEERLPKPRSSSSGVAHRDVTQARRMRQTCVQGTGCDTKALIGPASHDR